jgi:phage anti-repressor protein
MRLSSELNLIPKNTIDLFLRSTELDEQGKWFTSEEVCTFLGYENRNLSRVLNGFSEGEDFKIAAAQGEQQRTVNGGAGLNKKRYEISIDTVRDLAMRKNRELRKHYIILEKVMKAYYKYQTTFMNYVKERERVRAIEDKKRLEEEAQKLKAEKEKLEEEGEAYESRLSNLQNEMKQIEEKKREMFVYEIRVKGDTERRFPYYIGSTQCSLQERFNGHKNQAVSRAIDNLDKFAIELGYSQLEVIERMSVKCRSKEEIENEEYKLISEESTKHPDLVLNKRRGNKNFPRQPSLDRRSSSLDVTRWDPVNPVRLEKINISNVKSESQNMSKLAFASAWKSSTPAQKLQFYGLPKLLKLARTKNISCGANINKEEIVALLQDKVIDRDFPIR